MLRRVLFGEFQRVYLSGRWFRRHFTLTGQMLIGAMILSAAFGVDTTQTLSFQIFAVCAALLLLGVMGGWLCRVQVRVRRVLPPFASVEEEFIYRVEVENLTARTQRGLSIQEHLQCPPIRYREFHAYFQKIGASNGNRFDDYIGYPQWVMLWEQRCGAYFAEQAIPPLLPHDQISMRIEMSPLRRGYVQLRGYSIVCPDPLGIFKTFQYHVAPTKLLVLPKRYPVPTLSLPGRRCYQPGGVNLAMSVGDAVEFVSLRDYRPGDPLHHIHWKSWARRGKPVVKEFQDEFFTRHALILDTFVPAQGLSRFEGAVSVAASFACQLLTQDTLLDCMFVGQTTYHFTGGRGLGHIDEMLEILACVEACENVDFTSLTSLVMQHTATLSACVCILLDADEVRQNLLTKLRNAGVPVLVLILCEAGDTRELSGMHRIRLDHIQEDLQALA